MIEGTACPGVRELGEPAEAPRARGRRLTVELGLALDTPPPDDAHAAPRVCMC